MLFPYYRAPLELLHRSCFTASGLEVATLTSGELGSHPLGWHLTTFEGVQFLYLLPLEAPFGVPKVVIVHPDPDTLAWRNVEADGTVCLFPPGEPNLPLVQPFAINRVVESILRIIASNLDQAGEPDLIGQRQRWLTGQLACVSILDPAFRVGQALAARFGDRWVLGESHARLHSWLGNLGMEADAIGQAVVRQAAAFKEVPWNESELSLDDRQFIESGGLIVFALESAAGPIGLALRRDGSGELNRLRVDRADPAWLHDRGGAGFDTELAAASVAIVGCGSLGGEIALLLARSGITDIALIDHDSLSWDNVGRHLLGGSDVGADKANRLRVRLRRHFPTIDKVRSFCMPWQEVAAKHPDVLEASVIISTTAAWPEELALAEWARSRHIPFVAGWIEPHAIAGHSLALLGGCLACQFTPDGTFKGAAGLWEDQPPLRFAQACHESYFPYGYADALPVQSMIAKLVIDVICGKVTSGIHRARLPDLARIVDAGAVPGPDYKALHDEGQVENSWQEIERMLAADGQCWFCSGMSASH